MESVARGVAHFDVLDMYENIVVLLYGKMTPAQRALARKKNKICVNKVLLALPYLIKTHAE